MILQKDTYETSSMFRTFPIEFSFLIICDYWDMVSEQASQNFFVLIFLSHIYKSKNATCSNFTWC